MFESIHKLLHSGEDYEVILPVVPSVNVKVNRKHIELDIDVLTLVSILMKSGRGSA